MNCFSRFHFIFLCLFLTESVQAQLCSTTGYKTAVSFSNNNLIGTSNFFSTSNARDNDGAYAISWATLSLLGSAKTNFLTASNFNFSLPPTATICGVTASIKKKATGINLLNWITDEQVKLIKGGTITGTNKATNTHWTSFDQVEAYGGATDTWGATLTAADVNSTNFGVAIAADYNGVLGALLSADIDYVQAKVHYNVVLPLLLQSFDCHLSNNTTNIKCNTEEEEDNASISLERSDDGNPWKTLKKYKLKNNHSQQKYEYKDVLKDAGKYQYRLKLEHQNGTISYSQTSVISFEGSPEVVLFPNPALDWLQLSLLVPTDKVAIFNLQQQVITVPLKRENNKVSIDVSSLSKGLYFIKMGNVVKRFVKE